MTFDKKRVSLIMRLTKEIGIYEINRLIIGKGYMYWVDFCLFLIKG